MRNKLTMVSLLAGSFFVSSTVMAEDFNAKWEEADAKRNEAAEMKYEWRDTGKILKSAKKESQAGNVDKAMELVAQALEQSNDAIAQAKREKENWKARVPK